MIIVNKIEEGLNIMSLLENIYENSPIFFQNIMTSVKGYQNSKKRFGREYYEYKKFLKEFDEWTIEKKLEYQTNELSKFIKFARDNSEFYRTLYSKIDVNSINSIEDLKKLPIVNKETIRENIKDIITIEKGKGIENHTGGTTGKSLIVLCTLRDNMRNMAFLDNYRERVGFINRKMKRATFNGKHIVPPKQKKPIFWRYNASGKQMIFSSFHISERNIGFYVKKLNEFKPQAIDGFLSSMCDIASYIERHNIKLEFQPIAIFPTSEMLTDESRNLLERTFSCKVYNQYGSSEGAPVLNECSSQSLHMEMASGIFEHVEEGKEEILVTGFTTYGTPLIRYRIGDSMSFTKEAEKCNCGIESPLVKKIEGRSNDFLYTAEGGKIHGGNISNIFKNIPNAIIRAQVVQDKIGEVTILLEIDKTNFIPEYNQKIRSEFIQKFGVSTKLNIEHVADITREKSGKFRIVKNNVSDYAIY